MNNAQSFEQYITFAELISAQFGDTCHSTLYSFLEPKGRVIFSKGNIISEEEGSPVPKYIMNIYENANEKPKNHLGFINKNLNGYVLRTSHLFIYDEKNLCIGCLAVHVNIVHVKMMISFLEELTRSSNLEDDTELTNVSDNEYSGIDSVQSYVILAVDQFMHTRVGLRNFAALEKYEKIALISELDEKGIFAVKGAVNLVANRINMTKFAIYNYLDEIRSSNGNSDNIKLF